MFRLASLVRRYGHLLRDTADSHDNGGSNRRPPFDPEVCIALLLHLGLFDGRMFVWLCRVASTTRHALAIATANLQSKADAKAHARTQLQGRNHLKWWKSDNGDNGDGDATQSTRPDVAAPQKTVVEDSSPEWSTDVQPLLLVAPLPLLMATTECLLATASNLVGMATEVCHEHRHDDDECDCRHRQQAQRQQITSVPFVWAIALCRPHKKSGVVFCRT